MMNETRINQLSERMINLCKCTVHQLRRVPKGFVPIVTGLILWNKTKTGISLGIAGWWKGRDEPGAG
jgi:hypothetical protein